ncbi:MAG: sodium-dependent transporter [Acidobacteriota bacterium]
MKRPERFTSRWGLIISVLGIAVGTGNIWRFPRIAAANGGGSFLIPWVIFLFVWSIPLIIAEFAIGKYTRHAPPGAFSRLLGERRAWAGGFVALVATAIMFYYSVVAGWCFRYLALSLTNRLLNIADPVADWSRFLHSGWQPVLFHFFAISVAALIIRRGVVRGIEMANRLLIPCLLVLILVSAVRAVTLPGATQGLAYLFTPDLEALLNYRVWLQALTQNAWDTGAGWGLILTYAIYMREREDVPLNAAMIGLGNNSVSLLAGIIVFCTVFALVPGQAEQVVRTTGPANTGLTFIWIPQLFGKIPGGAWFVAFFFLALTSAAVSSLISMLELATRVLIDLNMTRSRALSIAYAAGFLFGLPSALSTQFFLNQDWVWGVGLMLSGALIAWAIRARGARRFREHHVNSVDGDLKVGRWWDWLMRYGIPAQVLILVSWWFWQVIDSDPEHWWNPLRAGSVGTCLFQWALALVLLLVLNRFITRRMRQS